MVFSPDRVSGVHPGRGGGSASTCTAASYEKGLNKVRATFWIEVNPGEYKCNVMTLSNKFEYFLSSNDE